MEETQPRDAEASLPALTGVAFNYMLAAGPWMRFLGIVSFAVSGFLLIFGVVMTFAGDALDLIPGGVAEGLVYIVSAALCFFPARFIFLTGSSLRSLQMGGGADALEASLRSNKAYWKFSGVLAIAGLALTVLLVIIAVVLAFVRGA